MALIVNSGVMGPDLEQTLHPFFTTSRTYSKPMPKVEPAPVTLTDPSLSDHNAAMVCGNSDIKTARQGKPRTSSVPSTTKLQMQLSIPPSGELNRDSQVDSKSGSRKTVQDTSIGPCPSYDFPDPRFDSFAGSDEGRRKRRRTAPPISESHPPIKADEESWEKQLEAAAASGEDTVVRGRALQVPKSEQSPVVADGLPPDKSTMSSFLDSTPVRKGTKPTKESTSSNSPELNAKRKTPPKKMLKLSSDGKFGSPSSRSIVNETRLRRRKPTSQDLSTKKIVVMRYGSNRSSQLSIGQKIQEILARPRGIVKAGQLSARPQEPLKPTHPFFLGKSNRISGRETHSSSHSVAENSEVVSGLSEGERRTSPRKRRTSGESRANVEAWAGLSGFRSATRSAQATREPKFPGAVRPIWPPKRMLHLRGCTDAAAFNYEGQGQKNPPRRRQYRKLKNAQFELPRDEDILDPYLQLSHVRADALQSSFRYPRSPEALRRPTRILMEGPTLQGTMLRRLNHDMTRDRNHDQMSEDSEYRCGSSQNEVLQSHSALPRLYNSLATSLAAFDKFECEQLEWIHKYSPKCAKEVLQPGREAILLRDWLKGLTVTSVDSGKTRDTSKGESGPPKKTSTRPKKKRRKLDGFVISSDEENNEMDEISDVEDFETFQRMQLVTKKSVVRAGDSTGQAKLSERSPKATNAVVISGPHGCGKTASVYAVARELGFEVFEINAGSRRSGKDLLEKVGEMTRNHLVRQDSEECTTSSSNNLAGYQQPTEKDIGSERRSTMNAFLKPQQKTKSKSKRSRKSKASDLRPETMKKPQRHKQSLILLEEVDVLFEEDKLFWTTTLDLIKQSKRPIIMTCTDEARLPLSDMILHAIFRLVPIPENLAIDYLVLLAGAEGHILSRDSLSLLYRARNRDLRASIAELNFYCQMGIGDTKGGLEWMLTPPSSKGEKVTERGLRVLSEGTYLEGMGFLSHDQPHEDNKGLCEKELELLSQAFDGWNIDAEDWYDFMDPKLVLGTTHPKSRQESLKELDDFQQVFEALSAADTFPDSHFSCRMDAILDPSQPDLTQQERANYVDGLSLLQTDPYYDETGLGKDINLAIKISSRKVLLSQDRDESLIALTNSSMNQAIVNSSCDSSIQRETFRLSSSSAFSPIAEPTVGAQISSFDGPFSTIMEDIAPYIRSIVSYDLKLEEQRLYLSNLLSRGGRNGKKIRTTRASRAALEGGSKANTRRERWFPKKTNLPLVLQTGAKGGQEAVERYLTNASDIGFDYDGSRRSSMTSLTGSDL